MDSEATEDQNLGDRTLALTLKQAISADCKIEGLNQKLVHDLET